MVKLYCFDFDGTLTTKDTMFLFLKFYNKKKYYRQFLKFLPLFILLKMGLLKAEQVKESFIASLLKGESQEKLKHASEKFYELNAEIILRPNAKRFISQMHEEGHFGVIVSASLNIWLEPFARQLNLDLICTQAQFVDNKFSGKFSTPNCTQQEKVVRLKRYLDGKRVDRLVAFGDSSGDFPMLEYSNEGHYKYFH